MQEHFSGNILLVTPGYPKEDNRYSFGFVHTRMKEYQKLNWKIDLVVALNTESTEFYEYEGIKVCKTNFENIKKLLQNKKYEKILIHFFDENHAQILDGLDISNTKIYLYSHGADTIYRDFNKMTATYFNEPKPISKKQEKYFRKRDEVINRYNNMENVKWVFVTEWTKKRSEETNNIKYRNVIVIPCLVDERTFTFEEKNPNLRKKIFMLRKFDNMSIYAIDINVKIILELSKRPFFNDLEFNIYGKGSEHARLLEPIKEFSNVNIYEKFLSHDEIAEMHKQNGLALFATRYDSQAVSSCEAAMSGVVVISSKNPGIRQVIDEQLGTLCDTEDYIQYADKIEEFYYDEKKFLETSKKMHEFIIERCGYDVTIKKEIEMFREDEG